MKKTFWQYAKKHSPYFGVIAFLKGGLAVVFINILQGSLTDLIEVVRQLLSFGYMIVILDTIFLWIQFRIFED